MKKGAAIPCVFMKGSPLLKSFLFNYYFYFFADLSRFHCDIGCSLFLSGDHALGI